MNNETNNERNRLLCPQCGGNLQMKEEGERQFLTCPYCGYSELLEKELTAEEKLALAHQLTYERERGRLRAKAEYESKMRRKMAFRKHLPKLIAALAVITALGAGILFSVCNPLKKTINPFDYVEIVFSGADGSGKAEIVPLPIDGEGNDIRYSLSDDFNLSEGQLIVLKAAGGTYNLKERQKTYSVSGLDLYVTDLSQLDEAAQAYIRRQTDNKIRIGYGEALSLLFGVIDKQYDTYTARPVRLILLSDGQWENAMLDVYEITFSREDEAATVLIAYEISNVVLCRNDIAPLSFHHDAFVGDLIYLGDTSGWGEHYLGAVTGFADEEALDLYVRQEAADRGFTVLQTIPANN